MMVVDGLMLEQEQPNLEYSTGLDHWALRHLQGI